MSSLGSDESLRLSWFSGCLSGTSGYRCGNGLPIVVSPGLRGSHAVRSHCISTWHWVLCGMLLLARRDKGRKPDFWAPVNTLMHIWSGLIWLALGFVSFFITWPHILCKMCQAEKENTKQGLCEHCFTWILLICVSLSLVNKRRPAYWSTWKQFLRGWSLPYWFSPSRVSSASFLEEPRWVVSELMKFKRQCGSL